VISFANLVTDIPLAQMSKMMIRIVAPVSTDVMREKKPANMVSAKRNIKLL
jgi:hypothetical protein